MYFNDIHSSYQHLTDTDASSAECKIAYKIDEQTEKASNYIPDSAADLAGFTGLSAVYFPSAVLRGAKEEIDSGLDRIDSFLEEETKDA